MKVLMLGWEFPPMFSGGLGIATYGMVKSLRHNADIKLIIPTSNGSVTLPNVNIIGLNKISASELSAGQINYEELTSAVHRIPLTLSPYKHINEEIIKHKLDQHDVSTEGAKTIEVIHDIFSGKDMYGGDILKKINLYTQLAEQIASDKDYDIIHAHDWITFTAGVRIKKMSGKHALVLHVHSLETDRAGESCRNGIYTLEKEAMMDADRIFAVSQFTKDQIIQHYKIDGDKISVVHNGIDPGQIPRKPHQLKDKLVVFLGRITHQKGPEFLLETVEKVSQVYPRVKFVVAGTGDQFAHLLETSAYKKMGSKFIFAGFLSKARVDELLSMADVYFMPSVSEPFGITALEAVQHRVPSVLSMQSGAAEVLRAALKADFWDTDKYANYIYALLKYDALKNELSEHAKTELDHITWDHAAEKIFDGYQQLLKSQNN